MQVPQIALNVRAKEFAKLVNLSNDTTASMTANPNFLVPQIDLGDMAAQTTMVADAFAKWGGIHHRGSQADYADLVVKAATLHSMLKTQAGYVEGQAAIAAGLDYATMAAIIRTSGFALKSQPHHQGLLEAVRSFRAVSAPGLNRNQVKLEWEKPVGVTSRDNVKSYEVYRSATTIFADAVQIATVSKTSHVDTNDTGSMVSWTYFVRAVGSSGPGEVSNALTVSLVPNA